MSEERPEALLRSALEKIVYFEARSKQLDNDVTAARAEVDRLKAELAQAAQREIELRRHVAGIEVELGRSHRERDELARITDALRAERTSVLQQIIEAAQIQGADAVDGDMQIDLAAFISQLRSEALNVTQAKAGTSAPVANAEPVAFVSDDELSFEFASMQGYPGAVPTLASAKPIPDTRPYAFDTSAELTAYATARAQAELTAAADASQLASSANGRDGVFSAHASHQEIRASVTAQRTTNTYGAQDRRTSLAAHEARSPLTVHGAPNTAYAANGSHEGARESLAVHSASNTAYAANGSHEGARTQLAAHGAPNPSYAATGSHERARASVSMQGASNTSYAAHRSHEGARSPLGSHRAPHTPYSAPATAASSRVGVGVATISSAAARVSAQAERLLSEGRLQVSREDVERLSSASTFPGRTEETLFGFSVRELSAPDPSARARAAERLRALGQSAAAPALAAALHSEREPSVQVALLSAFGELAQKEGVAVVMPLLDAPFADVRVSALKALLELDATQAGPHLSAAMKDADRAVRRRASLLALGLEGAAARALGEQAVHDSDAEVRALGALVLGAGGGEHARSLLLSALRDPEKKVRKAAAQSLSRILGEDLSGVVEMDDPQRRREVRRLATLPVKPVSLSHRERAGVRAASKPAPTPEPIFQPSVDRVEAAPVVAAPSVVASMAPSPSPSPEGRGDRAAGETLASALAGELRISIRGRTIAELSSITDSPAPSVLDACELLVARGQAVKRGTKFFAA